MIKAALNEKLDAARLVEARDAQDEWEEFQSDAIAADCRLGAGHEEARAFSPRVASHLIRYRTSIKHVGGTT